MVHKFDASDLATGVNIFVRISIVGEIERRIFLPNAVHWPFCTWCKEFGEANPRSNIKLT